MNVMKDQITENLNNPGILEDLYHSDKKTFSECINELNNNDPVLIIQCWHARLFHKQMNKKDNTKKYLLTALLVIISWIPLRFAFEYLAFINVNVLFPIILSIALSIFLQIDSIKTGSISVKKILIGIIPYIILYVYFLFLPQKSNSQSLNNAYYFMLVLLWFFILLSQSDYNYKNLEYKIFIEKCGEVIIWSTIFIIGGAVIVLLSVGLFSAIGVSAQNFYFENIVTLGVTAAPFVSLLVISNSKIKLSLTIANIFLPIILASLAVFGIVSLFTQTKPYDNRDIFIIYNVMMVLVICILVFTGNNNIENKIIKICAFILPIVTIIMDIVTLSAVIYRLDRYGITPNKITLLGTNIIMLGHLFFIMYLKYKNKTEKNVIYLPVYFVWSVCVVFILPFVFGMA